MTEPVWIAADDDDAPTPQVEDVQQQAPHVPPLKVEVEGTARTYTLPSRSGASRNYTIDSAVNGPMILLGQDLRRRRATIIATTNPIYVGSADDCRNGSAAIWPADTPLVIEHTEQVYVWPTTGAATVSVIAENWAD